MGLFDYFKARRQRESAVASLEITAEPSTRLQPSSSSFGGDAETAPPVNAAGAMGLAELGQIGKLIAHAAKEGDIQVHTGEPQAIDMQGTDLGEEIKAILARYGVETETPYEDGAGTESGA